MEKLNQAICKKGNISWPSTFIPGRQSWFMFKGPSTYQQTHSKWNIPWYIHTVDYLSVRNRNELYATMWMKLKNILLSEIIQLQKPYIMKFHVNERPRIDKDRSTETWSVVAWGWGEGERKLGRNGECLLLGTGFLFGVVKII